MVKLYKKGAVTYFVIILVTLISTLILWLPFILGVKTINGVSVETPNFQTVIKHWDGPLYIIPAKSLYDKDHPVLEQQPLGLSEKYFAAHLPLYPLTIRFLSPFLGYPKSMLLSTVLTSTGLVCFFYFFVKKLRLTKKPFVLSMVFSFFTPRFLVVRSIGAPEPLFILLVLASIYFFIEQNFFWAGLVGGLSAATKTPGILLFAAYSLFFTEKYLKTGKIRLDWFWIGLIPVGLLSVFLLYAAKLGDFLAYFHSGDNIHLVFPPFSVFNFQKEWIKTAWLEEIIFIYFFYLLSLFTIAKKRSLRTIFYFMIVFFVSIVSVQHRDISRYSLPLLPFTLIAFEKFFTSKKFIFALLILLPAIYLYGWNFMLYNIAPITDWTPFI